MDTLTISNLKNNIIEFDVDIQGLDTENIKVYFVINTSIMEIRLHTTKQDDYKDKWHVDVPPMPFIERTAYPYYIEVIADGYYFKPLSGTVNVVGTPEIYVAKVQNTTIPPAVSDVSTTSTASNIPDVDSQELNTTTTVSQSTPVNDNKLRSKDQIAFDILKQVVSEKKTKPTKKTKKPTFKKMFKMSTTTETPMNEEQDEPRIDAVADQKVKDILKTTKTSKTSPFKKGKVILN